eukprot:GEMP01064825.1.p1 GENE.GEMP01064825.1~~GEMP01064825.1.p1  ORF type:complete len:237 (+),score=46.62 GEMP01064825.1:98-808(+)
MAMLDLRADTSELAQIISGGCPYRADDINDAEGAVSTGTTIMAAMFDGGVVLAADSRTSMGTYVSNRTSRKISKVHDRIYVLRSGSAADTQALTGLVQEYFGLHAIELGKLPTVNTCAKLFQLMAYHNKDHLLAGMIVAGWDEEKGGQLFSIPLGGSKIALPYAAGGSGSGYISGLIDATWRVNMSKEECRDWIKKCVAHAMSRDGSSGGVIRTVVITKDGVEEDFTPGDKLPYGP